MASAQLGFDDRDLLTATGDSWRHLPTLLGDLLERSAVAVERGRLAHKSLPALNCYVHVLRVQLEAQADALGELRRCKRCSTPEEGFVNQLPTLGVVQDRARRMSSTGFWVG